MNFFDYFEIAVLALALAFVIAKALYLRLARKTPAIMIGRRKTIAFVFEVLAVIGFTAWAAEIVLRALHSSFNFVPAGFRIVLFSSLPLKIAGVCVASAGLLIDALALLNFGDSWRVGIDEENAGALVTGGIFAFTRNPIYLAFDLIFIGIFLINGTLIVLIFALLAIVASHRQIVREEGFLKKQYGQSYDDYRERVARYLIW